MTTAMASMNPVVSHWAVEAPIRKSSMRAGSATVSTVSLRIMISAETTRTEITAVMCLVVGRSGSSASADSAAVSATARS